MPERDDDKPRPPEQPTPPPRPKALPFDPTGIDWDKEMGAWDAAFPIPEEPTRPGGAEEGPPPPEPNSSELVLDDLSEPHTLPALAEEQLDDLSEEMEIDEDLPEPVPDARRGRSRWAPRARASPRTWSAFRAASRRHRCPGPRNPATCSSSPTWPSWRRRPPPFPSASTPRRPRPCPSRATWNGARGRRLGRRGARWSPTGCRTCRSCGRATPAPVAAVDTGGAPFDDPLPEEAPVELRLEMPPVAWVWSAEAVAEEVAAGVTTGATTDDDYWKAQLALAVDESAVVQRDEHATPRARAQVLLWAARAAERGGRGDALRLYEQVLVVDPSLPEAAAALRGQFRLLYAAGAGAEARDRLTALAEATPPEAEAYRTLLALAREAATLEQQGAPAEFSVALGGMPGMILAAERAFAAGDRLEAGKRLTDLAEELGGLSGETLRELAVLLAESGPADRPAALREGAGAYAQEARGLVDLRSASRQPPGEAREQLTAAASALAGTPLASAVRRWAARLARQRVQPPPLFSMTRACWDPRHPGPSAWSGLRLMRSPGISTSWQRGSTRCRRRPYRCWRDGWPRRCPTTGEGMRSPCFERAGDRDRLRDGTASGAPSGDTLLALAAERLAAGADRELALEAWRLIALHDPARSAVAHQVQAQLLLSGPDPASRAAGLQALAAAVAAAPQEASFWALSWQQRKQGHAEQAGESLVAGGAAWEAAGAGHIATALRDRAAELAAAARPDALLDRLPARSFAVDLGDDPRQLARELLARADDPKAMASTWTAAATGGSALRVAEAAGWLIEAGKPAEALGWLMDAGAHGESDALSLYLRRLVRQGDAASQATVLSELLEALPESTPAMERAELEMLRAEALALSGRRREAADLYREQLAGPLAGDADLAMRRVLWSMRDGEALESLWRDEHDAQFGAGRLRGAAAARWRRPGSSATCAATPRPPPRSCARRWRRIRDIRWPG